jgi:hypothetical protein
MKSVLRWMSIILLLALAAAAQPPSSMLAPTTSAPDVCESTGGNLPHADALRRVCEYAVSLPRQMPNFTCEQKTSRFVNGQAADVITSQVTYAGGRESYQNVKLDGHAVPDAALPQAGTWSTGQFESDVRALFDGSNTVDWQFVSKTEVDGRPALVFRYQVAHQDVPQWQLHANDKVVAPPYEGELWIDEGSAALLRLDVVATELPSDFPLSRAAVQINYGEVPFGDGASFRLPVMSVVNSTGTAGRQSRNVLSFHNCRKFRATSRILMPEN